jgi:gp16 family phage-associated protein
MNAEAFKAWLRSQGITIDAWARDHGFPPRAVYRVLSGVDKANHGRAHEIAVAAGLKRPPSYVQGGRR